ncbi:hypothetical protein AB0M36_20025 [Actinoplanes sp. NPDC051346]|uniref:hypothetical protein n=1 Tax=Actinoplanes sp. NPDC051346 TaxID=3155048 RepID=UPI003415785A
MTYAVQPPAAAAPTPGPVATRRRPASISIASVLLIVMAVVGLGYAVATLAVAPGTVDRFRHAAGDSADVDGFVAVIWIGAAVGAALAVILFALYIVLALGLRRGSNGMRIATLVVCALGLVAGCGSTMTVGLQRAGRSTPGSVGEALTESYPDAWIALNVGLGIAQMIGYVLVGVLLLIANGEFFGRAPKPLPPDPFAAPAGMPPAGYGAMLGGYPAPPVYGAPYPAGPASVVLGTAEDPDTPNPWAPPRPTTPIAPVPSDAPSGYAQGQVSPPSDQSTGAVEPGSTVHNPDESSPEHRSS